MTSRLAIMMGGRVAEELVFGAERVTSGAPSDIEQATKLARMMVTRWGLSEELGTVAYGENQDEVFLGYSVARTQNISEETRRRSTRRSAGWSRPAMPKRRRSCEEKRADLETLAKGLLEFETLSGDEIKDLLDGKRPVRESVIEPTTPRSSAVPSAGKGRPPRPDAPLDPQPAAAGVISRQTTRTPADPAGVSLCHRRSTLTGSSAAPRPAPAARSRSASCARRSG